MKQKVKVKKHVGPVIRSCDPTDHAFHSVDLTPRTNYTAMSMGSIGSGPIYPLIKLFCSKCGEIRGIA